MVGKNREQEWRKEFLAMYDREADALFRYVFYRTRDREKAVDILQESYFRVLRHLAKGNAIEQLRPFLYTTATHLIYDETKRGRERGADSLDEIIEKDGEPAGEITPHEFDGLDIERMHSILSELTPPEYREVLILRFLEEWEIGEIAKLMNISENLVSVRINRALKKLRDQFYKDHE